MTHGPDRSAELRPQEAADPVPALGGRARAQRARARPLADRPVHPDPREDAARRAARTAPPRERRRACWISSSRSARTKHVPPNLLAAAKGGIGVRIVNAPEEYFQCWRRSARASAPLRVELELEPEPSSSFRGTPRSAAASRFQVFVGPDPRPRSRRVDVTAPDAELRGACALERAGRGLEGAARRVGLRSHQSRKAGPRDRRARSARARPRHPPRARRSARRGRPR